MVKLASMLATALAAGPAVLSSLLQPAAALSPDDGCVVLTGASGFVAGHVAEVLLERGYTVRGTVRDPQNKAKIAHLEALDDRLPGSISFHAADLNAEDPFTEVARGCVAMLHVASPATWSSSVDPYEAIVKPAIEGTNSALKAAHAAGMKSVVVTSSVSAVRPTAEKIAQGTNAQPFDESDWNDVASLTYGTYSFSKVQAEKAAYAFVEENAPTFKLGTVHFPVALGPQHTNRVTSSNGFVKHILLGEIPFLMPMCLDVVDVRDVARAHVHVMETDTAKGRFIIAHGESHYLTMGGLAASLRQVLPDYPVASVVAPLSVMKVVSKVDDRVSDFQYDEASRCPHVRFDGTRLRETGFIYRHTDVHETVADCARSMVELGIVDGKRHLVPAAYAVMALPVVLSIALATAVCAVVKKLT
eukprot:INCI13225.1.p1 GENE.INCI13225.1~~INCI13225.1.p1  ORF type:complete len:417 (-),score=79.73 INCI13225.1:586-1836(-)